MARSAWHAVVGGLLLGVAVALGGCGPGASTSARSGTGQIAMQVRWAGGPVSSAAVRPVALAQPQTVPSAVVTMHVVVSGPGMSNVTQDFPISQYPHSGTVNNVPAGTNRSADVQGWDSHNTEIYDGTVTGITVVAGNTAQAGAVTMAPVATTMSSIQVTPATKTVAAGASQQFTATADYSDGTTIDITADATWGSSDTGVATIASGALASAVAAGGPVTITATYGGKTGTAQLTVTPAVPSTPTGVSATAGDSQVTVNWSAVNGATSYNLYWSTSSGVTPSNGTKIAGVTSPYVQTGLTNGTAYYYVVTAVNGGGESTASSEVSATPEPPAPGAPTGVSATAGDRSVTLNWTGVTGATGYNVYRSTTSGMTPTTGTRVNGNTPVAATTYTDSTVSNGTAYYYVVTAVNGGGESAASAQVGATPVAILTSITVTPSSDSVLVGNTQQITATGHYSDSTTADLTSQVMWTSSDTSVVTISSVGLATAVARGGPVTISAGFGGHSGTAQFVATVWGAVAAGYRDSLGSRSDGTLWAWDDNVYGQLGDGTTTQRPSPVQVGTATNWSAMVAGHYHNLGLHSDGTLWAWGYNSNGQLGDGTTTNRSSPVQIGTATNWSVVAAGEFHSLGLRSDGTLWAWGNNSHGQLGDGTTTDGNVPERIGTATNWSSVAGGLYSSLGLRSDGTLWAWGYNSNGQLGDGTTTDSNAPKQIGTATNWSAVAAGDYHSLGLRSDGTLWAWGLNNFGQLGDGTMTDRYSPEQIGTAANWSAVAVGEYHSLGLRSDGTLWAWGYNSNGQLGDGTTTDSKVPEQIGTATNWSAVAARQYHSLGLRSDGTLWAWGYSSNGQLGDGTTTDRHTPVEVK